MTRLLLALALMLPLAACSNAEPSTAARSPETTGSPTLATPGASAGAFAKYPRLSCDGSKTGSTFEWGFGGPPAPSGGLTDADALVQVEHLVRKRNVEVAKARYLVLAKSGDREARVYLVPDSTGKVMVQVRLSTVASRVSKVPDRWIADGWEFCG